MTDHIADAGKKVSDHSALIERLEGAANGVVSMKTDRGDYGLLNEAAAALRDLTEWRDIADAPKDGSEFQAWVMSDSPNWKQGWWEPKARIDPEHGGLQVWGRIDYDAEGWDHYPATGARWLPLPSEPGQPVSDRYKLAEPLSNPQQLEGEA